MSETADAREPRRAPRPTIRGAMLGAVGLVGLVAGLATRRADVVLIGLVLVFAVGGALAALAATRPSVTARRTIRPDAVHAGDEAEVTIVVHGRDARAIECEWRDETPTDIVGSADAELRAVDGHPETRVLRYSARAERRGRYDIGPLLVRRVDALGLATVDAVVGGTESLLVSPRVVPLDASPLDDAVAGGAELVVMRRSTPSVDEVSARDYERGDPLRRMNWRASAKRGRLMVRQEEQRSNPQSWVLLDSIGARFDRPSDAFELGVELVASIGAHAIERGFTVGVMETGDPQLTGEAFAVGAGYAPPHDDRLLVTELAALSPALPGVDPVGAFADAIRRAGSGTAVFAVLGNGPTDWWLELAAVRGLAALAVAFLLTDKAASALPELRSAGWTCVAVEPSMNAATAWAAAIEALGGRTAARG